MRLSGKIGKFGVVVATVLVGVTVSSGAPSVPETPPLPPPATPVVTATASGSITFVPAPWWKPFSPDKWGYLAKVDGAVTPAKAITATCTCVEDPFSGGSNTGSGNGTAQGRLYVEVVTLSMDPSWATGSATSRITVTADPFNSN